MIFYRHKSFLYSDPDLTFGCGQIRAQKTSLIQVLYTYFRGVSTQVAIKAIATLVAKKAGNIDQLNFVRPHQV